MVNGKRYIVMKKYLLCVVITILFVACDSTNDLGTPFTKGQEVTLTAIIGEQRPQLLPGKQRVSGVDAGEKINLVWDNGDKILVKVDDHSAEFTLSGGAGTGEGTFTGIMPADGTSFHVEYPIDYSDDVLKVQQYVPNGFGKGLMKMSTKQAGTIDNGFTLSADNALLGLQLTGNRKIGKIVLSRNNSEGKAGSESYTLLCPNVMLSATPTLFYIVVLPGTWANGFTVEVIANDNSIVIDRFVKTSSITFGTDMATIMPEKNVQNPPKRIGVFSVGEGKYVSFSQGNLQYIQSTKTWQFAENQQEYIGAANVNGGALADKIDLFGWSANNTTAPFGISTSINNADYAGEFVDWGINWISGDAPHTWRTLSIDEWKYLYHERENADKLFALGTINGIAGMILLPDDWQLPEGVTYKLPTANGLVWDDNYNGGGYINSNEQANHYQDNIYTIEQWQVMEQADAVFLPAAGFREKTDFSNKSTTPPSDNVGSYATSTMSDQNNYYFMRFIHREVRKYNYLLHRGRAVRLVHDTIPLN